MPSIESLITVAVALAVIAQVPVTDSSEMTTCDGYRTWTSRPNCYKCDLLLYSTCNHVQLHEGTFVKISPAQAGQYKNLTFINSHLPTIPTGVFAQVGKISELYLNDTGIEVLQQAAFLGLDRLEKLHLENNNIREISGGVVSYCKNLTVLDISNNSIEMLTADSLKDLTELRELYAHNNKIGALPEAVFGSLNRLRTLDLSHNRLHTSLGHSISNSLQIPESVTYLNLSHNNLTALNPSLFAHSSNLTVINVAHNNICEVHASTFNQMKNLTDLDMDYNSLSYIPIGLFSSLSQLKSLDLSNNKLVGLNFGAFTGLLGLSRLNLSSNNLDVHLRILSGLRNLTELDISNNMFTSLDLRQVSGGLKKLKTISLESNRWSCKLLAEDLQTLDALKVHVVSGSTHKTSNVNGINCEDEIPSSTRRAPSTIDYNSTRESSSDLFSNRSDSKPNQTDINYLNINTFVLFAILVLLLFNTAMSYFQKRSTNRISKDQESEAHLELV